MCRSINAQAEFWIKIGMLAESHPTMTFTEIIAQQLKDSNVQVPQVNAA
jgi:hypothetical protein